MIVISGLLRYTHIITLGHGCTPDVVAIFFIIVIIAPLIQSGIYLITADISIFPIQIKLEQRIVVSGFKTGQVSRRTPYFGYIGIKYSRLVINDFTGRSQIQALEIWLGSDKPVGVYRHVRTFFFGLLRSDHNNSICSQSTINTSCCGIFQDSNTLYIIRIYLTQGQVGRHIIHNNQRHCSNIRRERTYTTKDRAHITVIRINIHTQTGYLPFQG